jgi:hypothetical protein
MAESLDGNQRELAAWICPAFGYKADTRTLHFLGEVGRLWIVISPGHQPCWVHFQSQHRREYDKACANRQSSPPKMRRRRH